jgi:hypothetical protein
MPGAHARMATPAMSDRIVFTGEAVDGTQVLVEWFPGDDAEVVYVSTRPSSYARWSAPVECVKRNG